MQRPSCRTARSWSPAVRPISGRPTLISADGRSARRVGPLAQARFKHAMLPLADGTVLVIGGTSDDRDRLASTEVYDPGTETFRPGPRLTYGRYKVGDGATELPDRRVVVAGGGPGAELLDRRRASAVPLPQVPGEVASFGTVSVVGPDLWLVGGYDTRIRLTLRDLRVPLAALPP